MKRLAREAGRELSGLLLVEAAGLQTGKTTTTEDAAVRTVGLRPERKGTSRRGMEGVKAAGEFI